MRAAVIGGGLQGTEALYLARKAGWVTMLVDRKPDPPSRGLADGFVHLDASQPRELTGIVAKADVVIPALENQAALWAVGSVAAKTGVPYLFCPVAYEVSASKHASNRLFARLGLAHPPLWPACGFPAIVKPDSASGSEGVCVAHSRREMEALGQNDPRGGGRVIQAFLDGPLFSIEVLRAGGTCTPLQVTDLYMDAAYDCKRVSAPTRLDPGLVRQLGQMAVDIAEAIDLFGVMDLEVVLHAGRLELLEIDARLPSQTPTAVYWSTGFNMVQALGEMALGGTPPAADLARARGVVYEHIRVRPGILETGGEHMMRGAGALRLVKNFFGADEALTDFDGKRDGWVATLIAGGETLEQAQLKRRQAIDAIAREYGIQRIVDPEPLAGRPSNLP